MTELLLGNNKDLLEEMEDESIDALVTDPPYLINFMGKDWDKENSPAGDADFWALVMKKMKPGAHGLIFGHSRQHHRVMAALEDAGFEIRDCMMWLYGQGFPKSHNVGKAIDALQKTGKSNPKSLKQVEQEHGGESYQLRGRNNGIMGEEKVWNRKSYETQTGWEGWGTALKPAYEPIIMVRKPIEKKLTVAKNVLKHGVGGINIDGCRVGTEKVQAHHAPKGTFAGGEQGRGSDKNYYENTGRFPANVMLDEEAAKLLDEQSGTKKGSGKRSKGSGSGGIWNSSTGKPAGDTYGDSGGASRFFYCPKVSKKERNFGCDGLSDKNWKHPGLGGSVAEDGIHNKNGTGTVRGVSKNDHPTVKPIALMRYLIKLITPEGGKVLDPFMGSGSTGMAAVLEGKDFVGMEMDKDYLEIAEARVAWAEKQK